MGAVGPSLSATGKTISVFQRRSRKCFQVKRQCFYVAGSNLRPRKPMPSSRWGIGRFCLSESKCTVSARFLHGFTPYRGCFSLQNATRGAEITEKNHAALCKNDDESKLPLFETTPRPALLISGPRVRVPGGAPQQQNPNFFPIGEGFGFFVFFGKQNESLASIEKRPRPYHKKAQQTTVRVP